MLEQKSNSEKIEIIETRSISQEAFINLGDESNHENVCPDDVLFRVLKAIANEEETEIIDQKGEDSETYLTTISTEPKILWEFKNCQFYLIKRRLRGGGVQKLPILRRNSLWTAPMDLIKISMRSIFLAKDLRDLLSLLWSYGMADLA